MEDGEGDSELPPDIGNPVLQQSIYVIHRDRNKDHLTQIQAASEADGSEEGGNLWNMIKS